jgi:hypothetical protein
MSNLKSNIAEAQKAIRNTKKADPSIYPQYTELSIARLEYEKAKARYEKALKVWRKLGNH